MVYNSLNSSLPRSCTGLVYVHLTDDERYHIYEAQVEGLTLTDIARGMGLLAGRRPPIPSLRMCPLMMPCGFVLRRCNRMT